MKLSKEQAKHLAETTRIVAIAQLAAFGYTAVVNQQYALAILSTLWFFGGGMSSTLSKRPSPEGGSLNILHQGVPGIWFVPCFVRFRLKNANPATQVAPFETGQPL